jgi:hypothetical protein
MTSKRAPLPNACATGVTVVKPDRWAAFEFPDLEGNVRRSRRRAGQVYRGNVVAESIDDRPSPGRTS